MTKPLVFNYAHYERLRDYANDLLLDNHQLMEDNRKLRKENAELKTLNDGYVKIIAKNQETNNKLMASVQKQTGGEWVVTVHCSNAYGFRKWIEIECPFCGERPTYENLDNMNFCPNCGSKMTPYKGGDDE